jgi:hypothetical protein
LLERSAAVPYCTSIPVVINILADPPVSYSIQV